MLFFSYGLPQWSANARKPVIILFRRARLVWTSRAALRDIAGVSLASKRRNGYRGFLGKHMAESIEVVGVLCRRAKRDLLSSSRVRACVRAWNSPSLS